MAAISDHSGAATPVPTPWQAVLLIPVTLVLCGVFIGISAALGSAEFYAGFFFLLYWAGFLRADFRQLPAATLGAFAGVALGLLLQQLDARLGATIGGLAFTAALLPVLYFYLRNQLTLVINPATMLLLTASAITHVQAHASFRGMFVSLALAVVFFGGLIWLVEKVKAAAAARAGVSVAAE